MVVQPSHEGMMMHPFVEEAWLGSGAPARQVIRARAGIPPRLACLKPHVLHLPCLFPTSLHSSGLCS